MTPLGNDLWPSRSLLCILMILFLLHAAHAADAARDAYTICVSYEVPHCVQEWEASSAFLKNRGHEACRPRAVRHSKNSRPVDPEPYGSRMTALGNDLWPSSSVLCILNDINQ